MPKWMSEASEDEQKVFANAMKHNQAAAKLASGARNPVFGFDNTWFFWDETWADACGPFESEVRANEALHKYCFDHLGQRAERERGA